MQRESVEMVYARVILDYPFLSASVLQSGYPARADDDPHVSDVDIALLADVDTLDTISWHVTHKPTLAIMTTSNYARRVNVYVTRDPHAFMRGVKDRLQHLAYAHAHPALVPQVQKLKRAYSCVSAASTNLAWEHCLNARVTMPPHFQAALNVVLREISNEPTILNQLPHDILRKLILYVGDLPRKQDIMVKGHRMLVTEVEKALNNDTFTYPEGDKYDVKIAKCSYCDKVHLWADYGPWLMDVCACVDCYGLICRRDTCPGYELNHCSKCVQTYVVGRCAKCVQK
jgi:hypothetical protein